MLMRYIYMTIFLLFIGLVTFAQDEDYPKGYIHTKNNYHLTGSIGRVDHSVAGSMVLFVNDFGTPYYLHPALIKGFVFYEGSALKAYESKFWKDRWMFLSVQYVGKNIKLLQTPRKLTEFSVTSNKNKQKQAKLNEYWLEVPGQSILPVKKIGFRWKMKKLIKEVSPSLASKIGKKGYRFKDLYIILDKYDKEWSKGIRSL